MPVENQAKHALNAAPRRAQQVKIRLAGNRSASPESAKTSVPRMKPNCTALVRVPMSATLTLHAFLKSSAALFALNQSDVPSNWAIAIVATALKRGLTPGREISVPFIADALAQSSAIPPACGTPRLRSNPSSRIIYAPGIDRWILHALKLVTGSRMNRAEVLTHVSRRKHPANSAMVSRGLEREQNSDRLRSTGARCDRTRTNRISGRASRAEKLL